jgi:hypothetical protein
LNQSETEKYQDLQIHGEEDLLRSAHRGGTADVLGLREDISKMEKEAGGDPVKLATANAYANARAQALRKELTDSAPSRYGMSIQEDHRFVQEQIDRGPDIKGALKALDRLQGDVNQSDVNGPIDAQDRGFPDDMKGVGKDLADAARKLANLPKVYVVGAAQ